MLLGLPAACFGLLWWAHWRWQRTADPRATLLWAAVSWGLLTVAIAELLSLFGALRWEWIAVSWGVACGLAGAVGWRAGGTLWPAMRGRRRPDGWTLALLGPVVLVVGMTLVLALASWPNEADSLRYHLVRVAHWAQNQSLAFYPAHRSPQNAFPPWAELAVLELTQLGWDDRVANLVQWSSMLGSVLGVSLLARKLGAGSRGQAFSALCCATLPMGILQATTTQNDYVLAFWLVCLVALLLHWRVRPEAPWRALGVGGALGLAVLTKGTAYLFVLPLLVGIAPYRSGWRSAAWLRSVPLIGLVALGLNLPLFARNYDAYGTVMGPASVTSGTSRIGLFNRLYSPAALGSNLARNASLHLVTSVPRLNRALANTIVGWHRWLGLDASDPRITWNRTLFEVRYLLPNPSYAGNLVQFLLIVGVLPWLARPSGWRGGRLVRWYALLLLVCFILFCLLLKWQPFHSRLHLPLFVLWSPVVGVALGRHTRLLGIAAVLLVLWSWQFLVGHSLHPLTGPRSVFTTSRMEQQFWRQPETLRGFTMAAGVLASVDCREIGLLPAGGTEMFDYPLRGLLAEHDLDRVRIEHVNVTGSSARLASRWPPFKPCALLSADGDRAIRPETVRFDRRTYRQAGPTGRVVVYLRGGR